MSQMEKSIYTPAHVALQQTLRQLRLGAGLRQEDLADRLEKPQSFVSKYESGERRLDLVELHQICAAAGATLSELVKRYEEQLAKCSPTERSSVFPKRSGPMSEP